MFCFALNARKTLEISSETSEGVHIIKPKLGSQSKELIEKCNELMTCLYKNLKTEKEIGKSFTKYWNGQENINTLVKKT